MGWKGIEIQKLGELILAWYYGGLKYSRDDAGIRGRCVAGDRVERNIQMASANQNSF